MLHWPDGKSVDLPRKSSFKAPDFIKNKKIVLFCKFTIEILCTYDV